MICVTIPQWHEESYDPGDLVSLTDIYALAPFLKAATLRSYATGRRAHRVYGPMPAPVCRISNRKLWLRTQIESWLVLHIPRSRHSRAAVARAQRDTMVAWPTTHD